MSKSRPLLLLLLLCFPVMVRAQTVLDSRFSRVNSFAVVGEYANDSSYVIMGTARNRKIGAIGLQYERRLVHRRLLDFSYMAELRPAIIESDPTASIRTVYTSPPPYVGTFVSQPEAVGKCVPSSSAFAIKTSDGIVYAGTNTTVCGRRQVFGQSLSPIGFRVNLMPRHRLQPTVSGLAGYMFSTQKIPIDSAGSYNFTYEFAAGLELYRSHQRSMRLEYALQHFSNAGTGDTNPGVDSGFVKLTYVFGR